MSKKTRYKKRLNRPAKTTKVKPTAPADEARTEVKDAVEKVLKKLHRRNVPKTPKMVLSSAVKPGYTVLVPEDEAKAAAEKVRSRPRGATPAAVPDETVGGTITKPGPIRTAPVHRLQHPRYDRYYTFRVGASEVIVEKYEGGKRTEIKSRSKPDARSFWKYLTDNVGYVRADTNPEPQRPEDAR